MKISEVLPKESISEVYFRYPFKMEGYPNLSSDIYPSYRKSRKNTKMEVS